MGRMSRLWLLFLVILIELSVAQKSCVTKNKCKKLGKKTGVVSSCQAKEDECEGKLVSGKKYCKDHKSCACCVPPMDCSEGTLVSCEALNGTCIGQDEMCDGRMVTGKTFCKFTDSCKCCFPDTPCASCSEGFHLYGEYCLHTNNTNTFTRDELVDYCEVRGATMAYPINDLKTWQAAITLATDSDIYRAHWVGAFQFYTSSGTEWFWLDGSPVQQDAWWTEGGFPTNSSLLDFLDCAVVDGHDSLLLNDYCLFVHHGLCQGPITLT